MQSFSQSSYPKILNDSAVVITNDQLKKTNIIFVKYNNLTKINSELEKQVVSYKSIVDNYYKIDSIQTSTINTLKYNLKISDKKLEDITTENENLKVKKKKLTKSSIYSWILSGVLFGFFIIK